VHTLYRKKNTPAEKKKSLRSQEFTLSEDATKKRKWAARNRLLCRRIRDCFVRYSGPLHKKKKKMMTMREDGREALRLRLPLEDKEELFKKNNEMKF